MKLAHLFNTFCSVYAAIVLGGGIRQHTVLEMPHNSLKLQVSAEGSGYYLFTVMLTAQTLYWLRFGLCYHSKVLQQGN